MKDKPFPIIILAGGLATRLRPITANLPKSLIKINREPFIIHQMRLLRDQGIKKVVLCVGYLGEQIEDLLGDGSKFNLQISYSYDGEKLLGTAGAIKKALPLAGDNFFVIYGDSYLLCNYMKVQDFFQNTNQPALMTVFKNNGLWDSSNVEYYDGEIITYNKINKTDRMHYIDYGLGVFNRNVFLSLKENKANDLANIYQQLLQQQQLSAYEVDQRFYEIGSLDGQKELAEFLLAGGK